jgi:hypothetical protein
MRTFSPFQLLSLILTTTLAGCGSGDLTLPADGSPATLRAMSGSGQQAAVGTQLPDPLVVRLTDVAGRRVSGETVEFRFQNDVPGAQFEPATTVTTNDTGFAFVQVRLGTTPGDQTIEAAVGASPSSGLLATFGVTAVAPQDDGGSHPGKGKKGGKGKGDHDD